MNPTSLLLLAFTLPQAPSVLPDTDPVFVEVTAGRGTLLAGETTAQLSAWDGEQWVEGRGHLSLLASATAVLRWHGRASLELTGPCELEWEACAPQETLEWSFQGLARAEIESRWSEVHIRLGDSWSIWMPPGAMHLRGVPGQEYEVLQHAGAVATYQWEGPQEHTRPLQVGVIGSPVRLGSDPSTSRPDRSAQLDGRSNWTWPWREETEGVATWGYRDWPWVTGPPQPVTVRVVHAPMPEPVHIPEPQIVVEAPEEPTPVVAETPDEPLVVETPPMEPTVQEPTPAPPTPHSFGGGDGTWGWESEKSKAAEPWRGLSEEGYRPFGDYFIQLKTGVFAEDLPDGGVRFWIPETFKASGWVLGPRLDARLDPGGSIEFGPSGALRKHSGGVRVLAALER